MTIASPQSSKLLAPLFAAIEEEQRVSVLHIGIPFSETMDFFSAFRCHMQVVDVFAELPLPDIEETEHGLEAYFRELFSFPADTAFDLCLFWDLFDFLDGEAMRAFLHAVQPYLHDTTRAHGFTVHNPRTPAFNYAYGIHDADAISIRPRRRNVPGYAPYSQHQLKDLLHCFRMERSVLLPDRRLELLLQAKLT